ncbi:MAG: COX15/CtaA family protein [Candidatus Zixiibacteriota bacterium]
MSKQNVGVADSPPAWLRRFAKFVFFSTFLLIIAGGLVTSTGSGLAVPDWPLSFGQFFPEMKGGVLFEHGHRMVAGTVGILMTALALAIWFVERRRWVRWLALAAWMAVVIQAILGGITVLHQLPTPVSVSHAGLASVFYSLTAVLALVTSKTWTNKRREDWKALPRSVVGLCIATSAVIYTQLILGAIMRHMGAGVAIPDFPKSFGMWIPPLTVMTVIMNFSHRVGALVVGLVLITMLVRMERLGTLADGYRSWARLLAGLYLVQFTLGALTVWSIKAVDITTAHVVTGATMFALSVILSFKSAGSRVMSVAPEKALRGHLSGASLQEATS